MRSIECEVVFEQTGGISIMGRGKLATGGYFQQANILSITLKVFDERFPGTPVNGSSGETLVVADTIFDTPQTTDPDSGDVIWKRDLIGFNFLARTKATHLPKGGRKYRFEYEIVPVGTSPQSLWAVARIPTASLYSK